jgi:hypothetical protein
LFIDGNASLKNATCRPDGRHVFLNQFLQANFSVSVLFSEEQVLIAGAASLAAAVLTAGAVSLALRVVVPVSTPFFDEPVAYSQALPHAGSRPGAAVRGSPSLIAFFLWS